MPRSFRVRGVVEGFYGTPWSHDARLRLLDFMAARRMNAYVYAPKDDAKHRHAWREPYTAAELDRFRELATRADSRGVRLGFAISPGLDIDYDSPADRRALVAKLQPLVDAGVPWFLLLLDDIPLVDGLAPRHADLTHHLSSVLRAERADLDLTMCPTEYVGTRPSAYLSDLAAALPTDVSVMWTGPTVCSPTITAADARAWTATLGGRPTIVWDNYPVNDASMTGAVHLGPYEGREPDLVDVVAGVLCNPMTQPHASRVALATAAAFLEDPDGYDADAAWEEALDVVGGERAPALRVLAHACAESALRPPERLPLGALVDTLAAEIDGPGWAAALGAVADALRAGRDLPAALDPTGPDDDLAVECGPWVAAAALEAEAGLSACRLVQQVKAVAIGTGPGRLRVAGPDAERAMHMLFGTLFSWAGARTNNRVVFGARFAIYSQVVQTADGRPAIDVSLALREDGSVIDRLCRTAVAAYEDWRTSGAPSAVEVYVDGAPVPVDEGGAVEITGGMALLRCGRTATRWTAAAPPLPFRDPRFEA